MTSALWAHDRSQTRRQWNQEIVWRMQEADPRNEQVPCQEISKTRRSPESGGFRSPSTPNHQRLHERKARGLYRTLLARAGRDDEAAVTVKPKQWTSANRETLASNEHRNALAATSKSPTRGQVKIPHLTMAG